VAELVAAFCASHAPGITGVPELAGPGQTERIWGAMEELHRELEAARPTALVICSNEHFTNFFLDNFPPLCIGVNEVNHGPVEEWIRVPPAAVPGSRPLATWILDQSFEAGFDLPFSEELHMDHGVMTILNFLTPTMNLPVVPIIQNCAVKPMPTLRRCYAFGAFLAEAIRSWPADERVALVGAGGISHWVGMPGMGKVDADFDRWFLDLFAQGRAADALSLTDEEIERHGNGCHEIRSWLTVAGAMGTRPARVLAYEPVTAWVTGMGVVTFDLAGSAASTRESTAAASS
jgi:aromatic ring-opening dioxygenase catalytic subunit (LigB family)